MTASDDPYAGLPPEYLKLLGHQPVVGNSNPVKDKGDPEGSIDGVSYEDWRDEEFGSPIAAPEW
ncbi:hypothetical protein OHB26_20995 [Nocardia sp. NBC_01503]|uniref:hypothetical protein n=1 Tax=Nocardia sp. NBC_01503 TaxID=2975997 RepID=UPI002E7BEC90|nr:hypothetical protein [Nocardia sp. NBC_01503]WTL29477.1 hypothetical protein OHB26_20995 [Nocardia sp. NBC_01503]